MTKEAYQKRMAQHEQSFDKLWAKMVEDTNTFIAKHPEKSMYHFKKLEHFSDQLCLSGAWIQDRVNGKMPKDRGSLTKKIRKALGYTFY